MRTSVQHTGKMGRWEVVTQLSCNKYGDYCMHSTVHIQKLSFRRSIVPYNQQRASTNTIGISWQHIEKTLFQKHRFGIIPLCSAAANSTQAGKSGT